MLAVRGLFQLGRTCYCFIARPKTTRLVTSTVSWKPSLWQPHIRGVSSVYIQKRFYQPDTMLRIILQCHDVPHIFRVISQNPTKAYPHHLAIGIRYAVEVCDENNEGYEFINTSEFQQISDKLALNCGTLSNVNLLRTVECLKSIGVANNMTLLVALVNECSRRIPAFAVHDVSKLLEYLIILKVDNTALIDSCVNRIESHLNQITNGRILVPLLGYYEKKFNELTEKSSDDHQTELKILSQRVTPILEVFLRYNKSPVIHDILKIGNLASFCLQWGIQSDDQVLLESLLHNRTFFQFPHEEFIHTLCCEMPQHFKTLDLSTISLINRYVSWHAVRDTMLLDAISEFITDNISRLKVADLQRLLLPLGKLNYLPKNCSQLFAKIDEMMQKHFWLSPMATVNVMLSLIQMGHFSALLSNLLSPNFLENLSNSGAYRFDDMKPKLCILDKAIELDYPAYNGARLPDDIKITAFYSQKDRFKPSQHLRDVTTCMDKITTGTQFYNYRPVLLPGYRADFEFFLDEDGNFLPVKDFVADPDIDAVQGKVISQQNDLKITSETLSNQRLVHGFTNQQQNNTMSLPDLSKQFAGNLFQQGSLNPYLVKEPEAIDKIEGSDNAGYCDESDDGNLTKNEGFYSKNAAYDSDDNCNVGSDAFYATYGKKPIMNPFGLIFQNSTSNNDNAEKSDSDDETTSAVYQKKDSSDYLLKEQQEFEFEQPDEIENQQSMEFVDKQNVLPWQLAAKSDYFRRVIVLVQDKLYYTHKSIMLLSRQDMQIRHLKAMGFDLIQLPYYEIDKLDDIEQLTEYVKAKIFTPKTAD
uniref:FAST kinase domain-containing protein 3-like n=1 Tax=Saccoglossus kowalevskii TaxID=10224 RepID=A0ABM0M589_SACKO|nr:PREDICTED: FAST kinase domain-containing protein 3-like [Saccoglossus kowalevskii]